MHPNGSLVKEGDIITRPKQADSLEVIAVAEEGGDALYTGSLAQDLLADLQEIGVSLLYVDHLPEDILDHTCSVVRWTKLTRNPYRTR